MFTGIIESNGIVTRLVSEKSNLVITIESDISAELKVDQSLAHDGVCLTVTNVTDKTHQITAIKETIDRTTLGQWKTGQLVNLERAMVFGARLDGHLVQGHVDDVAICQAVEDMDGSTLFTFAFDPTHAPLLVQKGSIAINGVSLTLVNPERDHFSVAIIPYTMEHTNFNKLMVGSSVNLEFDIMGKYFARMLDAYKPLMSSQ
ncbi:MAG: riboflavin synthase [Saprospiraceae bacterium]|nr:riboflavin synthase [Saprospiraceae bacterium]